MTEMVNMVYVLRHVRHVGHAGYGAHGAHGGGTLCPMSPLSHHHNGIEWDFVLHPSMAMLKV